ncbi:uncharacterized protein YjeT (DUF2065 family) [Streptacidiphilus sp. MAP12-16]|uniref:hypothetical protein n=1 Tax=Streptacidiphilus sp. MAP12-16 TaxID=3156300 RepID=UPI003518B5C5
MITYYAATQHQTPGSTLEAGAFALLLGLVFLWSGQTQRRKGRADAPPPAPFRAGDKLMVLHSHGPSRALRVFGWTLIALGSPCIATGLLLIVGGFVSLFR